MSVLNYRKYRGSRMGTRNMIALNTLMAMLIGVASQSVIAARMEVVNIIGTREDANLVAGSGDVITAEELEKFEYTDIHRILASVPGIYVRDEEGYGLRPNISIRGTFSDRSGKITLMEDGVLIAPAPYTASSAYYFPTTGRLSGVEVLKGPAAIEQGPYTVGGAVNLLSTPIPTEWGGFVQQELSSDDGYRTHAVYGGSEERYGLLIEAYTQATDGFSDIDDSDRDTGFKKDDLLLKARYKSAEGAKIYQQLDLKLQYSEESSDQTYVGLTEADFDRDEQRRYGLSRYDNMSNRHKGFSLSHLMEVDNVSWLTTAYYNEFARNWFKVNKIDGEGINEVITCANGGSCSGMTSAYGTYDSAYARGVLHGDNAADIRIKNNNRAYYSKGLQSRLEYTFDVGEISHELAVGVRYHEDSEARNQPEPTYFQDGKGGLKLAKDKAGSNSKKESDALSYFVADKISIGNLTLNPGVRVEDYTINGVDNRETLLGLGLLYQVSDNLQFLLGVNEGHSPSSTSKSDPENAMNYEAGLRYQSGGTSVEAVAFYSDYENIIGVCTNSGGAGTVSCAAGDTENGGEAVVRGLELQLSNSFSIDSELEVQVDLTYTYTDSEFQTNFVGAKVWGTVAKGDALPNMPENQLALRAGLELGAGWGGNLGLRYYSDTCATAACADFQDIDSFFTIDASVHYDYSDQIRLYVNVDNLTDRDGDIVSREPKAGARGQKPRSMVFGVKYNF